MHINQIFETVNKLHQQGQTERALAFIEETEQRLRASRNQLYRTANLPAEGREVGKYYTSTLQRLWKLRNTLAISKPEVKVNTLSEAFAQGRQQMKEQLCRVMDSIMRSEEPIEKKVEQAIIKRGQVKNMRLEFEMLAQYCQQHPDSEFSKQRLARAAGMGLTLIAVVEAKGWKVKGLKPFKALVGQITELAKA